jgi:ankyrin repeat protein
MDYTLVCQADRMFKESAAMCKCSLTIWILATTSLLHADSRLADAAMRNDRAMVVSLLGQNADVNSAQGDGMTALHWAAFNDDREMARILVKAGASVKSATREQALTPLLFACTNGDAELVELLLKAGADANSRSSNGTSALMRAASSGSAETVKLLIDHGANVNIKEAAQGETALFFAAGHNRPEVIRVLAGRGADLSVTSRVTVLQAKAKSVEDEDFPLDAEVILRDNLPPGDAAAKAALAGRRASATVMGGLTALLVGARDGHIDAVRALAEAGANLNEASAGDQTTPLVMAAVNAHWELVKFLVDKGADPNLANADGLAPLYATIDAQWAPLGGVSTPDSTQERISYLDVMKALLEHGANPDARLGKKLWFRPTAHDQMWVGTPGSTAFWRAAQATDVAAMRLLVEYRTNPRIPSAEGDTALMMAAGIGWAGNFSRNAPTPALEAVKLCVELGLDVNTQDVTGYTALAGAAWMGDNELVQYLVDKGAKLDVRTYRGWGVADMANGPSLRTTVPVPHPDTIALLLKMGAPPLTHNQGDTILGLGSEHRQLPAPVTPPKRNQ